MPLTNNDARPRIDLTIPGQRVTGAPKRYEFVAGQVVAKPYPNADAGWIRCKLMLQIQQVQSDNPTGTLIGPALFWLGSNDLYRRPDMAFLSVERWPIRQRPPAAEAWAVVPDLVVEFVGPSNRVAGSLQRVEDYFAAGVRLFWAFCPDQKQVYAYRSPKIVAVLDGGDVLDGDPVLPGFTLPLREVFETETDEPSLPSD